MPRVILSDGVGQIDGVAQLVLHQCRRHAMHRVTSATEAQAEIEVDAVYEEALVIQSELIEHVDPHQVARSNRVTNLPTGRVFPAAAGRDPRRQTHQTW